MNRIVPRDNNRLVNKLPVILMSNQIIVLNKIYKSNLNFNHFLKTTNKNKKIGLDKRFQDPLWKNQ